MTANQSSGRSPWRSPPKAAPPGLPAAAGKLRSRLRGGVAQGNVQIFRSSIALAIWVVWLLFAGANWIDLAVQGRDHTSVVAAALLLLVTGIAYVTAQRPRIIADDAGVTVKNPLRDHRIGWAGVTKVDLADLLRVHCAVASGGQKNRKVISSWAVPYSRRRQLAAEVRSRRTLGSRRSSFGLPYGRGLDYGGPAAGPAATGRAPASSVSTAEADAEMIVRLLSERATAAQAGTTWAGPAKATTAATVASGVTGWLEPLKSTWSSSAFAAVLIPALILLIVCLL